MKIAIILGTRPEIIKMSPIIKLLEQRKLDFFIIHTGQHYSYNLDQVFFEQLGLPKTKHNLNVGSGSHGAQTAKILTGVERVLKIENPGIVLVEGDTNSVLASALAAVKLQIKIGHVEAGLRSYDRQMPEEINRVLTDHCSDYLFAPTENAKAILLGEGIKEDKISVTGNTVVDAVYRNLELAEGSADCLDTFHLKPKGYFLATIHREENVDNPMRFASIIKGLNKVANSYQLPIIYPIHPHSKYNMQQFGIHHGDITLVDPCDFLGFIKLEKQAALILTDSGGVQEEACILGVPCVTLRDNTERPETIEVGANMLSGVSAEKIFESVVEMLEKCTGWQNPFGDGKASERIINIVTGGIDE